MRGCVVALALTFVFGPVLYPSPALALAPETTILRWTIVDAPGGLADRNDIRSPCEVNGIAVASDGQTLYAIDIPNATPPPVANPGIWKSSDGGISWSPTASQNLAESTPAPTLPVMDIAVAPDNPDLIAAVCLNAASTLRHEVYLSQDGGTEWVYAGAIPWTFGGSEQIGDIAISPSYVFAGKPTHDVIVGSRHPGDGISDGQVYILRHPGLGEWQAQGFTFGDVIAVRASPNYAADFSLVAMTATPQRTYVCLGYRDMAANTTAWNTDAGWPVELCPPDQSGGNTSGENRIITGDINLPLSFLGTSEDERLIFAAYDSNGTATGPTGQLMDDVYRLNNTLVTRLGLPGAGISARISSIAFWGDEESAKIIAGLVAADQSQASAVVWSSGDPLSSCPTWILSRKPPTGGGKDGYANVQLGWSPDGSVAFAATGSGNRDTPQKWADPTGAAWNGQPPDESSVSITADNGVSWNQISLIDTRINRLKSVAPTEDETTIYLASVNDGGFDSVWRSQSPVLGDIWERVMCLNGDSPLLRLAAAGDDAGIFWGDQGTDHLRGSEDYGQTWQDCLPNLIIQDVAASDNQTLYVLQSDGQVRRGRHAGGWRWATPVDTELAVCHTIVAYKDNVLVGAAAGATSPVAYSPDGGQSWLKISRPTPSSGNRHVAFDADFDTYRGLYVADDAGGIYRWNLKWSTIWDDLAPPDHSFYGIATGSRDALYGAFSSTQSGVDRTLYTRSRVPVPGVFWDFLTTDLPADVRFSAEPSSLNVSTSTLWSVDDRDYEPSDREGCLWAFTDTLAGAGPRLIEPGDEAVLGCDPVSGRNQEVDLRWQQLSLASVYEIEIARDIAFSLEITEAEPPANPYYEPPVLTSPAYRIEPGKLPEVNASYYWRIRVRQAATGQVIRSQWSTRDRFSIEPGFRVVARLLGPQALRPADGTSTVPASSVAFSWTPFKDATEYELILATDPALKDILARETVPTTAYRFAGRLDYGSSYFWQVSATRPVASEPSAVFTFTTRSRPSDGTAAPIPYEELLRCLQLSMVLNVLLLILAAGVIISSRRRRA